jgi:hypothetical protein
MQLILLHQPAAAVSPADASNPVNNIALQLVKFCMEPKTVLDERAIGTLVDYVLSSKQSKEYPLPDALSSTGAYYEFDTRIAFFPFMDYSYSSAIPAVITRPSSLRYSVWLTNRKETQKLPANWKPVPPAGAPVVIRGLERDSNTPDLNTGVYHEYDMERTLVLLNHKGRQVLISISKQVKESGVGKKGVILGNDSDWSYYYSGEPGTPKTGLGWVKSYIYDYFSVCVYVESGTTPTMVRAGVFQWLRAGWSGINFVKPAHILRGMKRFAQHTKTVLESPRLPALGQMVSMYQGLLNMPPNDLNKKYATLQSGLRSSAVKTGKISKPDPDEGPSLANIPREQMVDELMLEYLKVTLGKPTLVGQLLRDHAGTNPYLSQ